jgi:uncharacterized membrane protein YebE (DUF533 family)
MFDSKKILDALVQGAAQQGQGGLGGGLGGLLGSVLSGAQQQAGHGQQPGAAPGGGLGDLLGGLLGGQQRPGAAPQGQGGGAGGLGDLLGSLMGGAQGGQAGGAGGLGGLLGGLLGGAQQGGQGAPQAQAGGIGDILGSLLGQATGGARDAAQQVEAHTGIQGKIADAIEQATGRRPSADMIAQVQEYIANNPGLAGAAAAGAGGLVLGTRTGRTIAGSAAKLGGLALIAGLAYRAYQNYVAGKPPIQFGSDVREAPQNSAFSPEASDADSNSMLMLRAMIAAAAADGQIDEAEKKAILGNVQALGMDQEAVAFLNNEVANPADAATLAGEVQGPEQATALYTAALLAIDVNNRAERRFMDDLAEALGLDEQLVKQIEASTEGVKAA